MNVLQFIFDNRWAMTPCALEMMIEIAARNETLTPDVIAKAMHGSIWERYVDARGNISDFWALEAVNYPLLEGTRRVSVAGNVAVLPVVGPIFPRANLMTMSGGASVQSLAYDFNIALNDKSIDTIIMNYDSPGGSLTGTAEFAEQIFQARGKKEVISYIYGLGASAAYWMAAAGKEVVIAPTGEAGSIGVVAVYSTNKKEREKKGIEDYEVVSSQSPNKRPDPSTDAGKAQIQANVDAVANIFVNTMAQYRGIDASVVLEKYGQGKVFVGEEAISQGLADRIGSLEGLIKAQQSANKSTPFFLGGPMTLQELQAQHPSVYAEAIAIGKKEAEAGIADKLAAAKTEGVKEGATAENARIASIEAIKAVGADKVIKENKFNMEMTVEKVSTLILQDQKAQLDAMLDGTNKDGKSLADLAKGLGAQAPATGNEDEQMAVAAMVAGMNGNLK